MQIKNDFYFLIKKISSNGSFSQRFLKFNQQIEFSKFAFRCSPRQLFHSSFVLNHSCVLIYSPPSIINGRSKQKFQSYLSYSYYSPRSPDELSIRQGSALICRVSFAHSAFQQLRFAALTFALPVLVLL